MKVEENFTPDEKPEVREAALNALGAIGLPWIEGLQTHLVRALEDPNSVVRAMAAWSIGKLGPDFASAAIVAKMNKLLRDSFWKVRTAACITLGALGPECVESALDILLEALRTGAINRVIVSETIVKMGVSGERILVEILKRMRVKDAKLICPILASLELADVTQPTSDFVYEELLNSVA